jgi:hypothetical protein
MSDEHTSHPFAGPLAAMEAEIAAAEARGEPVMPQAHAMVARLRELMQALDGLNASLGTGPAPDAAPDATPDPSGDERAPD